MSSIPEIVPGTNTPTPSPTSSKCAKISYALSIILVLGSIFLSLAAQRVFPGCESLSLRNIEILKYLSLTTGIAGSIMLGSTFACGVFVSKESHQSPSLFHRIQHSLGATVTQRAPEKFAVKTCSPGLLQYHLSQKPQNSEHDKQYLLLTALQNYFLSLPQPHPTTSKAWLPSLGNLMKQALGPSPEASLRCIEILLQTRTEHTTDSDKLGTLDYLLKTFKERPEARLELLKLFLDHGTDSEELCWVAILADDVLAIQQLRQLRGNCIQIRGEIFDHVIQGVIQRGNTSIKMVEVLLPLATHENTHENNLILILESTQGIELKTSLTRLFLRQETMNISRVYIHLIKNNQLAELQLLRSIDFEESKAWERHLYLTYAIQQKCHFNTITGLIPYASLEDIDRCLAMPTQEYDLSIASQLQARKQQLLSQPS